MAKRAKENAKAQPEILKGWKAALAIIQTRGNYFVRTYIRFALTPWRLLRSFRVGAF